jgi:putative endonuclease
MPDGMAIPIAYTMYFVYILKFNNNQFYTGSTGDLSRRYQEHQNGKVESTRNRRPLELMHYEVYKLKSDAQRREKYLKTTEGKYFLRQQIRDLLIKLNIE